MSERYIFNKRLNRVHRMRKTLCLWLGLSIISFASFKSLGQQSQPVLVKSGEIEQAGYQSTLQNVDFRRNENGHGIATITFSNDNYQMHISEDNGNLSLALPGVKLGNEQLYKLDVVDFATPVSSIETFQSTDASRVEFVVKVIGWF